MKILVAVKRVIDYAVKIRVKADHSGVETANVKMSMNPFDEIALEEALRLKESGIATEVILVSMGGDAVQETLRAGLALGADRAIHVKTELTLEPLHAAKLLQALVKQEAAALVIMGKQAIDDDCNQTGQMLAGLLQWPQGTFASKITVENAHVTVVREIDGGLETVSLKLPAVITADLRLNQPRYASLPNIMKAKQKPLTQVTPEQLNIVIKPHSQTLKVTAPPARQMGVKLTSAAELMQKLTEAGAL